MPCRSRYGTPVYGILASSVGVFFISLKSFTDIVEALNCLYCLGVPLQVARSPPPEEGAPEVSPRVAGGS